VWNREELQQLPIGISCFISHCPRWWKTIVEYIRVNISTIRPSDRTILNSHVAEECRLVTNLLENGTVQVGLQVDFATRAIGEMQIYHKIFAEFRSLNSY